MQISIKNENFLHNKIFLHRILNVVSMLSFDFSEKGLDFGLDLGLDLKLDLVLAQACA